MSKTQASLEVVIMISVIVILSVLITQSSYLKQYAANTLLSHNKAVVNCEIISAAIMKSSQYFGLISRVYNYYNSTIDSFNSLITVYYPDGAAFCSFPNITITSVNISDGWVTVYNNGFNVEVVNS